MYSRTFSVAALVALFSGVWYYAVDPGSEKASLITSTTGTSRSNPSQPSGTFVPVDARSATPRVPTGPGEAPAQSPRKALVVEDDQFYTHDILDDAPLSKETGAQGQQQLEMLTPEQATEKLRRNQESWLVGRGRGVVRYDVVQIPSNNPIEDDHAEKIVEVPQTVTPAESGSPSSDWMFWGVFDGHSGWPTSAKLRQVLISFVARELNQTYKSALTDPAINIPTPSAIDAAIKKGFTLLDHEIVHESVEKVISSNTKRAAAELLAPALSGSCALLSFYDSKSKLFRVACTGDSRAILGRRGSNGRWTATALSEDQTGGTPSEIARLQAEHPGEQYVVRNGRILGALEPSRAFGDASYKWSRETQERIKKYFLGRTPSALLQTPPYVTAEPIVTTTKIEPEKGDFVVMATDGLWEFLSNEEVVGLVGQWLESQPPSSTPSASGSSWPKSWFSTAASSGLPVENPNSEQAGLGQRGPIRQYSTAKNSNERFVTEDKNAATHLVRNALGGKDRDMVCALLTLPSPYSRRYRDDLTVEVIFFGDAQGDGNVVQNREASTSAGDGIKAKL
ncbi:MAG: hypothetical protein HETSPECPRED_004330 [Heterodermia speciosa]|uniref:PPM-type phosphatase domain-containing protein n=1 Tax=Heterodermia speciosa TaxID=116794 RepID=A0A8H3F9M9_9LECA|nr:MAG: hypothetical protein HETSPECPRED_004330 [Heterodermia speciosa]